MGRMFPSCIFGQTRVLQAKGLKGIIFQGLGMWICFEDIMYNNYVIFCIMVPFFLSSGEKCFYWGHILYFFHFSAHLIHGQISPFVKCEL
jgi:hypothetical protein